MALTERIDVSLSWVVSFVVVVALLIELAAPQAVVSALPGGEVVSDLVSAVGTLTLALVAGIAIVVGWVVSARFGSRGRLTASGTADRVEDRFERFVSEWLSVTRIVATGLVAFGFMLATQFGTVLGEIGQYLAEAPVVVSQVATIGLGWVALGGNIPVIGTLFAGVTPQQWALIGLVLLGLGVTVRNA